MEYTNLTLEKGLGSCFGPALLHLQSLHKLKAELKKGSRAARREADSGMEKTWALGKEYFRSSCCWRPGDADLTKPAKEGLVIVFEGQNLYFVFFNLPCGE